MIFSTPCRIQHGAASTPGTTTTLENALHLETHMLSILRRACSRSSSRPQCSRIAIRLCFRAAKNSNPQLNGHHTAQYTLVTLTLQGLTPARAAHLWLASSPPRAAASFSNPKIFLTRHASSRLTVRSPPSALKQRTARDLQPSHANPVNGVRGRLLVRSAKSDGEHHCFDGVWGTLLPPLPP
jgi:hypothetical protein